MIGHLRRGLVNGRRVRANGGVNVNRNKRSVGWRQVAWLSVVATLTMFGRLDLVFFVLIVGIWIVFRDEPMRYLMPLDILAITAATLLAFVMRLGLPKYYESSDAALVMISIGLIVKIPVFFFMSLYQRPATWKPLESSLRLEHLVAHNGP